MNLSLTESKNIQHEAERVVELDKRNIHHDDQHATGQLRASESNPQHTVEWESCKGISNLHALHGVTAAVLGDTSKRRLPRAHGLGQQQQQPSNNRAVSDELGPDFEVLNSPHEEVKIPKTLVRNRLHDECQYASQRDARATSVGT